MSESLINLRLSQTEERLVARLMCGPMLTKDAEGILSSAEGLRTYIDRLRNKKWPLFSHTLSAPAKWAGSGVFVLYINSTPLRHPGRPKGQTPERSVRLENEALAAAERFRSITPMEAKMMSYRALRYLVDLRSVADAA